MSDLNKSRRKFIKTAAYVAPVVMSLNATASFARNGSGRVREHCNNGYGNGSESCSPDRGAHHGQDD